MQLQQYNVWTGQDDAVNTDPEAEYKYGNNDYIRLYNGGTAALNDCVDPNCPTTYLPPHKLQSNGVWFTKARNTTPPVFLQTPADVAAVSEEALYPDGEHTLTFHVEDAYGRTDRAENKAEDNAQVQTIVDNFRPYVKKVSITSGDALIYSAEWTWNGNRQLALAPDTIAKQADKGQPLHITVTTSEPMQLNTDATGKPTGIVNIKLFARDPNNPNRITTEQA